MITFKAKTASGEIINSKLKPFSFPAGEAHTKIEERREFEPTEIAIIQPSATSLHDDLFQLAMWENTIPAGIERVLLLPYAPGARADRGKPFGAEIYGEFIGNLCLDQIVVFDPHSPVIVNELRYQIGNAITVLGSEILASSLPKHYMGVIAPDKGAESRAKEFADVLGIPVFTVDKTRDFETGKLLGFKVPELDRDGRYLIVDDICDGGGTFLGIAIELDFPVDQLDLFVSHGVFSKQDGENLLVDFGDVYTTNSYDPTRELHDSITRFDIIRPMLNTIK